MVIDSLVIGRHHLRIPRHTTPRLTLGKPEHIGDIRG
jgi:hypothetical protein